MMIEFTFDSPVCTYLCGLGILEGLQHAGTICVERDLHMRDLCIRDLHIGDLHIKDLDIGDLFI